MTKFELGKKYKDTIHGIEGIATSHIRYLTGCDQIRLEWVLNGEVHSMYFDVTQLEGVDVPKEDRKPGGPKPHAPPRHA